MKNWWRNRDFILILSAVCGLLGGAGEPLVLAALAIVMTLSTTGVRRDILRSRQRWPGKDGPGPEGPLC
jgi:hypothetical protein